jgi:hypothetical protein
MRDPDVLRLAYGMALVRLVNGIVEPEQRTKTYASSVADTAERLGLPRWFVDIRHDATHTNLPSLSTLRMAAETALGWLMSHYWDRQAEHLDSEPKKIASLMNQYDQEVSKQQHKRKRATQESGSSSSSSNNHSSSNHSSSNHSTSTSSASSTISTQINAIEKRAKLSPSISKATSRTTSRSTSRATSRSGSRSSSRSSSPSVSVHSATTTPGGDLRLLAQHISQRISPSIIRTVIIPQLVDHVDNGRLLLYKKFNDTNMTTLKNKWMPVLHAVQQEWPFFYGALLATIVENIGRVCAQKLSTSKRKTDVELSLRWLADDVLTLILASSGSSGIDSSGSSSSSSSGSGGGGSSGSSSSINNSSSSQKSRPQQNSRRKRHRRHLHRVAPIDRQRLVDCVGVTNAISIYGNLLSSMLEATRMEDAASATRKSNSDVVIGSARAAELLLVDSEMRVLSKTSSVVVGGGVLSAVRPSKVVPQLLLSLEELENSIGMGTTAEEDDDEDEEEDEEEDENSRKEIVDKERQEGGTGDRGADDGNEWTLCTTWKSCPIGYVAVDGGENDNSSLLFT